MSTGSFSVIAGGRAWGGWEGLWGLDAWPFEQLPHADLDPDQHGVLAFGRIVQPWLREAAKRWARARLLRAISPASMRIYLRDLSTFSEWMAEQTPEVRSPALITRSLLEDYLLWVRTGTARRRPASGTCVWCGSSWPSSARTG